MRSESVSTKRPEQQVCREPTGGPRAGDGRGLHRRGHGTPDSRPESLAPRFPTEVTGFLCTRSCVSREETPRALLSPCQPPCAGLGSDPRAVRVSPASVALTWTTRGLCVSQAAAHTPTCKGTHRASGSWTTPFQVRRAEQDVGSTAPGGRLANSHPRNPVPALRTPSAASLKSYEIRESRLRY